MDSDENEYLEKTGDVQPEKFKDPVNGSDRIGNAENKYPSQGPKQKSGRHDEDFDHQVKRSRKGGGSYSHVRDRNSSLLHPSSSIEGERKERQKDRRSRESKNMDMDREREDGRRKERYRGKIRERNRERSKGREQRDHDCIYERETEKEREQESLNYNRNHSERYQDEWERERSQDRGISHDMEYKERGREREVRENDPESRGYGSLVSEHVPELRPAGEGIVGFRSVVCEKSIPRRTKEEREKVAEPESDPERDQQTVFAYQISLKADERDLYEFFSRAGKVRDVRLIMDRNSRRSKGFGYIEFYDVMSVPVAIALSGQSLLGHPVMVKPSEAEKNLLHSTTLAAGAAGHISTYSGEGRKLYVQNLHINMKEDQLREVFEAFGTVELVQLPSDPETGHGKGYGFIQFARLEDARAAQSLDGQLEIAGKLMKVSAVTDQAGGQEAGDFVDAGGDGLSLNLQSRKVLMQKLDCTATSARDSSLGASPAVSPSIAPLGQTSIPALTGLPAAKFSIPVAIPPINTIGNPSECLLLKNMFDPKVESEPEFDQDIKEDVEDECTKFGDLKHIYVDRNSAGFVYLRFQNSQSSIAAQRALHGRWFAGKMITATFVMPQNYEAKFPESK